jgi:hypothetical protein
MTLRDRLLPLVARARRIPADLGLRTITVSLVTVTGDGALHKTGTTETTTTLVITPTPKVRKLSPERGAWFAGGAEVGAGSPGGLAVYEIGPFTPEHAAGGHSVATLLRDASSRKRALWKLEGDGFAAGGEYFAEPAVDPTRPFRTTVTVVRTKQP